MKRILVWIRRDFRLHDNEALFAAANEGAELIPFFVYKCGQGAASKWWLYYSLEDFEARLAVLGAKLILREGRLTEELGSLIHESNATALYFNRDYEPEALRDEMEVSSAFENEIEIKKFSGNFLLSPERSKNAQGRAFRVFTPYFNAFLPILKEEGLKSWSEVKVLRSPSKWPRSLKLSDLKLLSRHEWATKFSKYWKVGEFEAIRRWEKFRETTIQSYAKDRDFPSIEGTSQLSPYLHFGQISVRRLAIDLQSQIQKGLKVELSFLRQIIWREFCASCIYHFENFATESFIEKFRAIKWSQSPSHLRAWQKGETGYPIVDAGMRELWETGWMHNRVRMIVGSFLVKHLQTNWTSGADWFWDTLLDADLGNNSFGWQWVASTGLDPVPYFRIFNPVLQSEKFDAEGEYIRRWVPELKKLSNRWIHSPWKAGDLELSAAGVCLGENYPHPIVDHASARKSILEVYSKH